MSHTIQPIRFEEGHLFLLNQIILPTDFVYEEVHNCEEAFDAIRDMKVRYTIIFNKYYFRGAPALAIAAVLAIATEANQMLNKEITKTMPVTTAFAAPDHLPFGPNASVPLVTITMPVDVLAALHMW